VVAGPISASLIRPFTEIESYGAMKYKAVILVHGFACMLGSTVSVAAWYVRQKRWLRAE
jgi:hypothetical protein